MQRYDSSSPQLSTAVRSMSILLWVPQLLGLCYTLLGSSTQTIVVTIVYMTAIMAATVIVAARYSGDLLMVLMWLAGLSSELLNLGIPEDLQWALSRTVWIALFLVYGLISGMLCKAKDIQDERFQEGYSVVERLYLVVPFTVGQWTSYVLLNGWSGVFNVFCSIFLSLTTVGYGALLHRVLARHGVYRYDPIEFVSKIFTTSFGMVLTTVAGSVILVIYLAVPFLTVMMSLNAVMSSFGIIGELVMYDLS